MTDISNTELFNKFSTALKKYNDMLEEKIQHHTNLLEEELEEERIRQNNKDKSSHKITKHYKNIEYHFFNNKHYYWLVNGEKYKTISHFNKHQLEELTIQQYRWYKSKYPKNKYLSHIFY